MLIYKHIILHFLNYLNMKFLHRSFTGFIFYLTSMIIVYGIDFSMIGYATVPGTDNETTTGGTGGDTVHIYTLSELQIWGSSREKNTDPEIAVIHGKIYTTSTTVISIKHGENITILGKDNADLQNVGLDIWDYKNVIVRNLTIHEVLYPDDAITINECYHVWIDHCELYSKIGENITVDTYDGMLDIKEGSRYVTVSWCYIHHHMKTMLIGHTDNLNQLAVDTAMRITIHHNYFSHTDGRNPSLRFGAVHLFNNYFDTIYDYGIAVRQGGHALIENNHYNSVNIPITTNKFSGTEGFVCESGTIYSGSCSASDNSITQTDCNFWNNLPYSYMLDSTKNVKNIVLENTGVMKNNEPMNIAQNSIISFTVGKVYPNPIRDKASLLIDLKEGGIITLEIFDIQGRFLRNSVIGYYNPGLHELSILRNDLKPGIYILKIKFNNSFCNKTIIFSE